MKIYIGEKEVEIDENYSYLLDFCIIRCSNYGYVQTRCNLTNLHLMQDFGYEPGNKVQFHRLIYQIHIGRKLSMEEHVDHIDTNKLNNKIENLRILTHSQNQKNKKIRNGQPYYNITYNRHANYFVFRHRETGTERSFKELKLALEYFEQYDTENNNTLTKSISNRKPIDQVENIILQNDAKCELCNKMLWSKSNLIIHNKAYHQFGK